MREELDAAKMELKHVQLQLAQKEESLEEQIILTEEQKMLRIEEQDKQLRMLEDQTRAEQERLKQRMNEEETKHIQEMFTLTDTKHMAIGSGNAWTVEGLNDDANEGHSTHQNDLPALKQGSKEEVSTILSNDTKKTGGMPRFARRGSQSSPHEIRLRLAAKQYADNHGQRPGPRIAMHTRKR